MNDVVLNAIRSLHQIKDETAAIVHKMNSVSTASDESYKNLEELENVLEDFKTVDAEIERESPASLPQSEEKTEEVTTHDADDSEPLELLE